MNKDVISTPNAPAAVGPYSQGIRVGDIVTAINGEGVRQTSDVAAIISQYDVGTIMTFTIYRDGETLQVDVTLMETSDIY